MQLPVPRRAVRWSVPAALLVTAILHLAFLSTDLGSDEGGFAMVGRHWLESGSYLYGPQWVDRPPLLIGVFWVADHLGAYGVRLMATAVAVAVVAVLSRAAFLAAAGNRPASAARWTAWVAAALVSSSLLDAQQLNGELVAALLVSVAVAGVLAAVRRPGPRAGAWMLGAGMAAFGAVLAKQNFVDGLAFAGIFLAVGAFRGLGWRRALRLSVAFAAGCLVPLVAALAWAHAGGGVDRLVYAMYGFRIDAARVIAAYSHAAPEGRAAELAGLALTSGLFTLLVVTAAAQARRLRHLQPLPWALLGTFLVELAGVVGGGNFWAHYLIALVPTVALAAGLSARREQRLWPSVRAAVVLSLAVTLVASPAEAVQAQLGRTTPAQVADWLRHSSRPGDTVTVPFTHANVIGMSHLTPVYPYSWSLPLRTLDPRLHLLVRTLQGPGSPTWVVRWDGPHMWDLDPHDRVARVLRKRYRVVATVCGHDVWLRRGVTRTPAPSTGGNCDVIV